MTCILWIRHGETDVAGRVMTGRSSGVHLNATGRTQAVMLHERLHGWAIREIFASPMERARETAEPLAERRQLDVRTLPELTEIDYGGWTGKSMQELDPDPAWQRYNRHRSIYRTPDGENLAEVQVRMLRALEYIGAQYPGDTVVAVSHGDPIKALLLHLLAIPLDFVARLEVLPSSINAVQVADGTPRVLCVNLLGDFIYPPG